MDALPAARAQMGLSLAFHMVLAGNADEADLHAAFPRGTCSHGENSLGRTVPGKRLPPG